MRNAKFGNTRWGQAVRITAAAMALTWVAGCAETQFLTHTAKRAEISIAGPSAVASSQYKVGNPYQIAGVWYYPAEEFDYDETGVASWYGPDFHGKSTANGELYDMNDLTAAHRTLPLPSFVRVTNLENGRGVNLRVNDRGPFAHGRIIDVSRRAAQLLGFEMQGTAKVRVQILEKESRAIAAKLKNETQLASTGKPITVDAMPKPAVSQESLAPPPGASVADSKVTLRQPVSAVAIEPRPAEAPALVTTNPADGTVTVATVAATRLFVQAGAYTQYVNANRTRAMLSSVGGAEIHHVMLNGRDIYRVRIGPMNSVEKADVALEQVIQAGYPDARIIVD